MEDPKKPDKSNPVLDAVLIAFFTALATKTVEKFFAWLNRNEKKKPKEDIDEDTKEDDE